MEKRVLIIVLALIISTSATAYNVGYINGSYIKARDLALTYEDGFKNGANPKNREIARKLRLP